MRLAIAAVALRALAADGERGDSMREAIHWII
jgi:hypothetical protein